MAKCVLALCFAGILHGGMASQDCSAGDGDKAACPNQDHSDDSALLQGRVRVSLDADEDKNMFTYGPYAESRKMMDYFKAWGQGKLRSRLARALDVYINPDDVDLVQLGSGSAAQASAALIAAAAAECPDQVPALAQERFKVLDMEPADTDGMQHMLLRSQKGGLQYLAMRKEEDDHRALVADPPVCRSLSLAQRPALKAGADTSNGGGAQILDPSDESVKDCKKLFHRTVKENCHKDFTLKVLAATATIVDGVSVHMEAKVCHGSNDCRMHHPECSFEESSNHTDASFLQESDDPFSKTQAERKGMTATLKLHVALCDADNTEGATAAGGLSVDLMETYSLGENSLSKGYEHVNDDLPKFGALDVSVPSSVDLRVKNPTCFNTLPGKNKGTETVRNQGTCGSCWAFASATTAMTNLCISNSGGSHTHNSDKDRKEVSTQKILSCAPSGKSTQSGCNGGNMAAFDAGAASYGLTPEKANPYKCGGGNPKNHFEQKDAKCDAFPWGGSCTGQRDSNWNWGGSFSLSGEQPIQTYLASGFSVYASLEVYGNFMNLGKEIYQYPSGGKKGGHALNLMAYGSESGTKYWVMQNSWGPHGWGDQGFGKILRGTNLCGIETGAYGVRAWVTGGTVPPCMDSSDGTGLSSNGSPPFIPCSQAKSGSYGNLCSSYPSVKKRCMAACGTCSGPAGPPMPSPPSPPSPPPSSSPPSPAPPSSHSSSGGTCADKSPSGIKLGGTMTACSSLKSYCTRYPVVQTNCPKSCGLCSGQGESSSSSGGCQDSATYKDPSFGDSCAGWSGYKCTGFGFSSELLKNCPKACRQC